MQNISSWPQLSGSLKIDPFNPTRVQPELSLDLSKLTPKLMIIGGLLLAAYGVYRYLNQEKKEVNR